MCIRNYNDFQGLEPKLFIKIAKKQRADFIFLIII